MQSMGIGPLVRRSRQAPTKGTPSSKMITIPEPWWCHAGWGRIQTQRDHLRPGAPRTPRSPLPDSVAAPLSLRIYRSNEIHPCGL